MKPGAVTTIRVSPMNCMLAIDLVKKAQLDYDGMSFAVVVSQALTIALEYMVKAGHLERRDGFEYEAMMKEFKYVKNSKGKIYARMMAEKDEQKGYRSTLEGVKHVAVIDDEKDNQFLERQITFAETMPEPDRTALIKQAYESVGRSVPVENKSE